MGFTRPSVSYHFQNSAIGRVRHHLRFLGMDSLELHNPQVNWVTKQVVFQKEGEAISLQGQHAGVPVCETISILQLKQMVNNREIEHMVFVCDGF